MTARLLAALPWIVLLVLTPPSALAQGTPAQDPRAQARPSRLWLMGGGGSTTMLGDCSDCEDASYGHAGSLIGAVGVSLNQRTDFGAEVLWIPTDLSTGDDVRMTFLMASVQFRPWQTRGFILRAGAGMAFVRNWLGTIEEDAPSLRSKAFGLGLAAGWEWRLSNRLGVQSFGAQHVAALGDLETSVRTAENVMGNFWSVGAAVVIR